MSVYFSQPCPIPYHIIHPQFFLFFSKKLHNALWKIEHIGRKYSLPLIQEQALYLIFYGEHSMNHSLILKISSLLPPGSCGGPDTDLKLDIMKLNSYIIQLTVYLCIFWYIENIRYIVYEIKCGLKIENPALHSWFYSEFGIGKWPVFSASASIYIFSKRNPNLVCDPTGAH